MPMLAFSPTRRLATLATLLAVTGCDSAGDDLQSYTGVVEVSLVRDAEGGTALRLVAVEDTGCQHPLVIETDATARRLGIHVMGIGPGPVSGVECQAVAPAAALVPLLPTGQIDLPVEVAHAGATDAYAYTDGFAGEFLRAVRTSTTRLAEAP